MAEAHGGQGLFVAFQRHTLLPLDDCLYALQATIPRLTRSSLHRCLQRHGISRMPEVTGDKTPKRRFKAYQIGYFHIDIAEVQTAEGKLRLFIAIDQTSKSAFVELHEQAGKMIAAQFLRNLVAAVSYKIHTVLTNNGIQFTNRACDRYAFHHIFDHVCDENGIEHRLTKVKHKWTNGQVERINRTIKEATVKRYHYDSHDQLRQHLGDFVAAYNFGRRLKTLKGLTPHEVICKAWQNEPARFTSNPHHEIPGSNTWPRQMRYDIMCEANDIGHQMTKRNHSWTNGQVARMNRTINDGNRQTLPLRQLRTYHADFVAVYNFFRTA